MRESKKSAKKAPTKKTESRLSVKAIEVDACRLVTIDIEHQVWGDESVTRADGFQGAIVKVLPPAEVSDDHIARVKRILIEGGAAAVRMMPRAKAGAIVVPFDAPKVERPHHSIRKIVELMTKEANTKEPDRLKEVVEMTMAKVGL